MSVTYKTIKVRLLNAIPLNKHDNDNELLGDEEYINGVPNGVVLYIPYN
ncbi:hypothetical protein [Fulvivirga sp.]